MGWELWVGTGGVHIQIHLTPFVLSSHPSHKPYLQFRSQKDRGLNRR
jgi:hypothetical protein